MKKPKPAPIKIHYEHRILLGRKTLKLWEEFWAKEFLKHQQTTLTNPST